MLPSKFRETMGRRPFRPLEVHLDDGEVLILKSPEFLLSAGEVIIMDAHRRYAWFNLSEVTSVRRRRVAPRNGRRVK